ncbi:hypothetical protein ID866_9890 [Astraeus odoratus]|nr:hypothetical protein ID866_9890 [Astraeus odoratus]
MGRQCFHPIPMQTCYDTHPLPPGLPCPGSLHQVHPASHLLNGMLCLLLQPWENWLHQSCHSLLLSREQLSCPCGLLFRAGNPLGFTHQLHIYSTHLYLC